MISSHNSIPLYCAGYMLAFQLQNLLYFYYSKKCIDIDHLSTKVWSNKSLNIIDYIF